MREQSLPNRIQTPDLEAIVAVLRKRAEQLEMTLPRDVALYIAQNLRSNQRKLELALASLAAHSSMTGTAITLSYTQRVLKNFIDPQARTLTVDPFQKLPSQQFGTQEAKTILQDPIVAESHFVLGLLKTHDGRKTRRVRHELEVNMRESEREGLARRDGYERELERRAKKRKPA